ncbi:MAG: MoaD/ThiS family protein [Bilophila sp.]
MNITVNGKGAECPDGASLSGLLRQLGLSPEQDRGGKERRDCPGGSLRLYGPRGGGYAELFIASAAADAPRRPAALRSEGCPILLLLRGDNVAPHEGGFPS